MLCYNYRYDNNKHLAAASKYSGDWLHEKPITSCGLLLDDESIRVAVGLRLGADICESHTCVCDATVNVHCSHTLSCKRISGRLMRHNYLNNVIWRSLTPTTIPATKAPRGFLPSDGKRLDGLTLIPWWEGCYLVWDITVADTTAAFSLPSTTITAGSAAESAAVRKEAKYAKLTARYKARYLNIIVMTCLNVYTILGILDIDSVIQ